MNFLGDIYKKSLYECEKNIKFWEEYVQNLKSLDFSVYSDKLTVPVLVPIGNKILFRGSLKHTNEVTVALGADYFTKCSIKQADILRQHRIRDARSKLDALNKEKDYLENQLSFSSGIINESKGEDIIEECTEEEDKAWREQHKERVRKYHQNKNKGEVKKSDGTDEELWSRLEELELQEELQNELVEANEKELDDSDKNEYDSFIIKEDDVTNIRNEPTNNTQDELSQITHNFPKQTSKIDVLLQVIDMQKMLEDKLTELKSRERVATKTESDLLSRLDEMEQLEDLEDEMDRLDEIIQHNDVQETEDSYRSDNSSTKNTRSVSFADQDDSETIEIYFKHSNNEASKEAYDPKKGITKPSDIYKAYSNLFENEATSILKKSKYDSAVESLYNENGNTKEIKVQTYARNEEEIETIVVKDVVEKCYKTENKVQYDTRPTSLFKKKRQQQKNNI